MMILKNAFWLGFGIVGLVWGAVPADSRALPSPTTPALIYPAVVQTIPLLTHKASTNTMLPEAIANAVLADLAEKTARSVADFTIQSATEKTWPDSCLGLSRPDQLCAQVMTPGWQVVVSDGKKTWTYRTDQRGKNIRPEA